MHLGHAGPATPARHAPCRQSKSVTVEVVVARRCSKPSCGNRAVATLTYIYSDSTAVLGPLATYAEPHCYDLCEAHSQRLTAPRGWEVVRLAPDPDALKPSVDDLEALANAVRESGRVEGAPATVELARRGHLRVLRDAGGPDTTTDAGAVRDHP